MKFKMYVVYQKSKNLKKAITKNIILRRLILYYNL